MWSNYKLNLNILFLHIVLCSYYKHRVNGSLFFRDLGKTVCFHSRTAGAYAPCNCKKRQCGVENNFRGKSWGMSQGRIIILKWSILKWSHEKQNKMRSFKNEYHAWKNCIAHFCEIDHIYKMTLQVGESEKVNFPDFINLI